MTFTDRNFFGTGISKSHVGARLSEALAKAASAFEPFGNEPENPPPGEFRQWVTRDTGDPLLDGLLMIKWTDTNGLTHTLPFGGVPESAVDILYPVFSSETQELNLPAAPNGVQGWKIRPSTSQPGKLIFGIDNRPLAAGWGVAAVRFSVKAKLTEDASYEIDLGYVDVPAAGFDLLSIPTFEVDSFLPGQKLDLNQCAEVNIRMSSLAGVNKCSISVLCGAPTSLEWSGVVGPG